MCENNLVKKSGRRSMKIDERRLNNVSMTLQTECLALLQKHVFDNNKAQLIDNKFSFVM